MDREYLCSLVAILIILIENARQNKMQLISKSYLLAVILSKTVHLTRTFVRTNLNGYSNVIYLYNILNATELFNLN